MTTHHFPYDAKIEAAKLADAETARVSHHALSCDCTPCCLVRDEAYRHYLKVTIRGL